MEPDLPSLRLVVVGLPAVVVLEEQDLDPSLVEVLGPLLVGVLAPAHTDMVDAARMADQVRCRADWDLAAFVLVAGILELDTANIPSVVDRSLELRTDQLLVLAVQDIAHIADTLDSVAYLELDGGMDRAVLDTTD